MKTFRMFTEDYMDSYDNLHRTSTGFGINSYVPHEFDLNLRNKKNLKEIKRI